MRNVLRSVIGACVFSLVAATSAGAEIAKKKSDVKADAGRKNGKAEPAKKDSKVAALTKQDPKAAQGAKTDSKSRPAPENKKHPTAKPASPKDAKGKPGESKKDAKGKPSDAKKDAKSKGSDAKGAKGKSAEAKKDAKAKPAAGKDAKSKNANAGKIKTADAKKKKRTKVRIWKDAKPALAGLASVYRYKKPRRGASGEIINFSTMIAAHRNFRFGTKVRVTNRRNGKSVIVRIIDRGPFVRGRVIDLSPAAARKIGMGWGLAPVTLAVVAAKA